MSEKLSTSLIQVTSHIKASIKVDTNGNLKVLTKAKGGPSFLILGLETWFTKGYQEY